MSDDRLAEARRLSAEGRTTREIAKALGVTQNTVLRWINPEFNKRQLAAQRMRRARDRGICSKCGGPTSWNWRTKKYGDPCAYCRMSPEMAERLRPSSSGDVASASRRIPDISRPEGEIDVQRLLTTFDCQAFGCVRDALPGQAYCRRHLDALASGE